MPSCDAVSGARKWLSAASLAAPAALLLFLSFRAGVAGVCAFAILVLIRTRLASTWLAKKRHQTRTDPVIP